MAVEVLTDKEVADLLPQVDVMKTLESMFGALGRGEALLGSIFEGEQLLRVHDKVGF